MLTEEDSLVYEQARDYHNMMVRLFHQARLHQFAGLGEPVPVSSVLFIFGEMEDMRAAVSRVACDYDDMDVNSIGVGLSCSLFSTWSVLLLAAGGRKSSHQPRMM